GHHVDARAAPPELPGQEAARHLGPRDEDAHPAKRAGPQDRDDPLGPVLFRDRGHAEASALQGGGRARADGDDGKAVQLPDVDPALEEALEEAGDAVNTREDAVMVQAEAG